MNKQYLKKWKISRLCAVPERRTHGSSLAIRVSRACWLLIIPNQQKLWENEPNVSLFTPCSAVEVTKKKMAKGKKRAITKGWECTVNLWRIKGACVYLSSPIDHHLKQEEWGRERSLQLGLFHTSLHCRPMHSGSEAAGKWRGWGGVTSLYRALSVQLMSSSHRGHVLHIKA